MRSAVLLMLLALSGCALFQTKAPKPPNVKRCSIVAVNGLEPYVFCRDLYNTGYEERIPIENANKFICTDPMGYEKTEKYTQELAKWINSNCQTKQ